MKFFSSDFILPQSISKTKKHPIGCFFLFYLHEALNDIRTNILENWDIIEANLSALTP
ncbi:MAG: hypothetical protein UY41_C0002G0033 [Candidatus Moranbacteria bacterium GW2011_GWE1_49_15]|nr:MAG: hypothetical protein UX75_C0003G0032 [Candidatus Moranbacteria bacterium GW2011_GWE2_47_10]KKW07516.1 MAG: hypothetical protein UY41_C0002G0033 [Candidatus Moranbacteria bacterium GW2011_GWE1_49_15]